jgi:hypothetical protein
MAKGATDQPMRRRVVGKDGQDFSDLSLAVAPSELHFASPAMLGVIQGGHVSMAQRNRATPPQMLIVNQVNRVGQLQYFIVRRRAQKGVPSRMNVYNLHVHFSMFLSVRIPFLIVLSSAASQSACNY